MAGYRLANYVVDLYKKADRKDGNLMGDQSTQRRFVLREKSVGEWTKWLAEDSRKAFKESPLRKIKKILNLITSES